MQLDAIVAQPALNADRIKAAGVIIETLEDSGSSSADDKDAAVDEWIYPHPTTFSLTERPIDEIRQLKVMLVDMTVPASKADLPGCCDRRRLNRHHRWLSITCQGAWYSADYFRKEQ
jgi:hypothetical protein